LAGDQLGRVSLAGGGIEEIAKLLSFGRCKLLKYGSIDDDPARFDLRFDICASGLQRFHPTLMRFCKRLESHKVSRVPTSSI